LFVISDDAGANWRVEGPADNQVGLVGWDEAANKAVLERPLGCGTNGSGDYWLEPGHVPVAKPKQCDQACHLRLARGLGMRWRVPGGGFDSSGSSIIPAVFARKAAVWTVAAGSDPSYWEGHEADALLLYEVQGETVSRVWRTEYPFGSFGSQIGANLFLGVELRQETSRGPQNIASREWPVIYDLQTNTVHEIAGLAPVSDQAEVRLEQVIRGAP
jgi:hypothetical protein